MRRVRHSRSGLFLIELMVCILFFSITAGICIRFFVKSHQMSQDAKDLYQAQQEAASMAEVLEKDVDSLNNICVYYDKEWKQCDKKEKVYSLEVTEEKNQTQQEKDIKKIKIAVYSGQNSKKEEIYHLNLSIYVPQEEKLQKEASNAKNLQGEKLQKEASNAKNLQGKKLQKATILKKNILYKRKVSILDKKLDKKGAVS